VPKTGPFSFSRLCVPPRALECARAPRIGDVYRRPSSRVWKNSRNKIGLGDPLRSDVIQVYREIEDWLTVVESGGHANMGSPALNNTTASLATRLPWVIEELEKVSNPKTNG
jgi:hypothetical protein